MSRRNRYHRRTQLRPVRQVIRIRPVRARVKPPSGSLARQSLRQLLRPVPIGQRHWFLLDS